MRKNTMKDGWYHDYESFPKPDEFTQEVWDRAVDIELAGAHAHDESPSMEMAIRVAQSIVISDKEKADAKLTSIKKLSAEVSILEYAFLQLANGYGDKVPLEDLKPLKTVIIEKKTELEKVK